MVISVKEGADWSWARLECELPGALAVGRFVCRGAHTSGNEKLYLGKREEVHRGQREGGRAHFQEIIALFKMSKWPPCVPSMLDTLFQFLLGRELQCHIPAACPLNSQGLFQSPWTPGMFIHLHCDRVKGLF